MLYVVLANLIVYVFSMFDESMLLYRVLCFDRYSILHGQVWRLVTYIFTGAFSYGNIIVLLISSLCYFSLGRAIENVWGTLRFNLFYFSGMLLMDVFALIFPCRADPLYLNIILLLSYATLYPNAQFFLLFIIPVKAWLMALIDLALLVLGVLTYPFPANLLPLVALFNYFLFFGKDVTNLLPLSWRRKRIRKPAAPAPQPHKPIPFRPAPQKQDFTHRCTVCGRTDISDPQLEFRYCSRCKGYHCYCEEHINDHTHVE